MSGVEQTFYQACTNNWLRLSWKLNFKPCLPKYLIMASHQYFLNLWRPKSVNMAQLEDNHVIKVPTGKTE